MRFKAAELRFKRHDVPFKVQGDKVAVYSLKFQVSSFKSSGATGKEGGC